MHELLDHVSGWSMRLDNGGCRLNGRENVGCRLTAAPQLVHMQSMHAPLANDAVRKMTTVYAVDSLVLLGQALVAQLRRPPQGQLQAAASQCCGLGERPLSSNRDCCQPRSRNRASYQT
eukprot:365949-Chlamydomonas_euryale.AAC.13